MMEEERTATVPVGHALKWTVAAIAIAMSLYHMYVAAFGPAEALIFRGTHLLFTLTLVFLLYPMKPGGGIGWKIADALFILGSWGFILHIFLNYQYINNRIIYIDALTTLDQMYAWFAVLIVLEATRRVLDWGLTITAALFLAYPIFFSQVPIPILLEQL